MTNDLINERWVAHRVHPEWQDGTMVRYVDSVSDGEICTLYGGDDDASVVTSRARLIAAAPELLGIVQKYLASADKPLGMSEIADIDAEARAIVAKAT